MKARAVVVVVSSSPQIQNREELFKFFVLFSGGQRNESPDGRETKKNQFLFSKIKLILVTLQSRRYYIRSRHSSILNPKRES